MYENEREYSTVVDGFLPDGARVIRLLRPNAPLAIRAADIDGDGETEIVAVYEDGGQTCLVILKENCGVWHNLTVIRNIGGYVTDVLAGRGSITIGRSVASGISKLAIYKFPARQMMYYDGYSVYILDFARGDVTGDRVMDSIYLVGDQPFGMDSTFAEEIVLLFQDGMKDGYERIPLPIRAGYRPSVYVGDFTGNGTNDILVRIGSQDGYEYSYIYSYIDGALQMIFDCAILQEAAYDVQYSDHYKVYIMDDNRTYTMDISHKSQDYLSRIYTETGGLKKKVSGAVSPLTEVYGVKRRAADAYELHAVQSIVGMSDDELGFIKTVMRWDGRQFVVCNRFVCVKEG